MATIRFVVPTSWSDTVRILTLAWTAALAAVALGPTELAAEPAREFSTEEVRAIWVTRWDFQTRADVEKAIRGAASLGLNRVFFQVRGRADAFYRSAYEPWGEEIGGRDPGFDPLAVAIEEARRVGIDLDAWINVLPGWKGSRPPHSRRHVYYKHPEWFLTDRSGKRLLREENRYTILNPCLPEVRAYLVRIVEDLASRYKFSGLHLDYVRFVARDPARGRDFPYDARTLRLFRNFAGDVPSRLPEKWNEWRRRNVNTVVYSLAKAYRAIRPSGRVSVAAIRDYERARTGLFQDVVTWQRRGWIDAVFPMTYSNETSTFIREARKTLSPSAGHNVFPGIGVYLLRTPDELSGQIAQTRRLGANGYALFALSNFFPTKSHESSNDRASKLLRAQMRRTLIEINHRTATRSRGKRRPVNVVGK